MGIERALILGLNADGSLRVGGPWVIAELKGPAVPGNGTAAITPSIVANANESRKALIIANLSNTEAIWLGIDSSVDASNGFPIPPLGYFMDNIANNAWWAMATTGADWRSMEVSL